MKSGKLFVAGALFLMFSSGSAFAGDLFDDDYRGSIKDDVDYVSDAERKWYLRGDLGYGVNADPVATDTDLGVFSDEDFDDNWSIGGGIGYRLSRGFRIDATLDYRFDADVYGVFPASPTTPLTGELSSLVGLVNLYYDFDMGHRITPYVGVGIGFAHHVMDEGELVSGADLPDFDGGSQTEFAWALMAGVDIDLQDRWKLDIGYRYLNMGDYSDVDVTTGTKTFHVDDLESHEIRIGLRYSFDCLRSCDASYEPMK